MPSSTYRIQLRSGVGFSDVSDRIGYLERLGVSDVYLSPPFAARPGSPHGYDVVDPTRADPELGGDEGLRALLAQIRGRGLGVVLDTVPNHMAASPHNPWWWDVLERGTGSPFARFFDIDWDAGDGKVVLPVLGAPYGEALGSGELRLVVDDGEPVVTYHDHRFPVNAGTRRRLWRIGRGDLVANVDLLAGTPGRPESVDLLDDLLERQDYRLTYWRSGELNYRRFFDITDLVCVRVEDTDVFETTHRLVNELVADDLVTALRVDHVDGLRDPAAYLERLREATAVPVLVEKIVARREELPRDWPVAGSTGYEFADVTEGLFVDPSGARHLARHAAAFTSEDAPFDEVVHLAKREVLDTLFRAEVERLAELAWELVRPTRHGRDVTHAELTDAVAELSASLPVYRTYVTDVPVGADRRRIEAASHEAAGRVGRGRARGVDLLCRLLCGDVAGDDARRIEVVARWQQLTGPAMAKGFEDTALYRYPPLTSRNEVGGDPGEPAVEPDDVHRFLRARRRRWPDAMSAGSTHDSKRSEDVRARIHVLSEIPDRWTRLVDRWHDRQGGPGDPVLELLVYQAIVGVWPLRSRERRGLGRRIRRYAVKAAREAKRHTSWRDPDPGFERDLERFVRRLLADEGFRTDVTGLLETVAPAGALNSLAALALRVATPGTPDVYRGTETWYLRLVDPDNREPVDLGRLEGALRRLDGRDPGELVARWQDGRIKLWCASRLLRARREHPDLFERGDHLPLETKGRHAGNVFAFTRRRRSEHLVAAVPRLTLGLPRDGPFPLGATSWDRTAIVLPDRAPSAWRDVLSGERIEARTRRGRRVLPLAQVFGTFPVALLLARKES